MTKEMSMRGVAILAGPHAETRDYPDPTPEGDKIVVRVEAAGLCGTDLRNLYEKDWAGIAIPGHEGAGTVVAVDKATRFKVGDRVFMMAFGGCGECVACVRGQATYCKSDQAGMHGFTIDGFQAEFALVAESQLVALPDDMTFEQGAITMDPIGTPYHSLKRMGIESQHTLGVFGCGPMGLGGLMIAAHKGCRVIGIEPIAYRRELAMKLGAADVIDPTDGDVAERIMELTNGAGIDRALECSGQSSALTAALDAAAIYGHVAIIAENNQATINPSSQFNRKELTLSGSTVFALLEFDEMARLYADGLAPERMITHRVGLEDSDATYQMFSAGDTGKVIFTPHG
jgi:threonine dehydrogenase-like Zn-dependent dehydrogenase